MKKIHMPAVLLLSLILLIQPITVLAFKPNTHVWVGQQVLDDVIPDGKVTINGEDYEVAGEIARALQDHPGDYRMGNVGPDVYPDPVVGQMTAHPGVSNAWQTDDWLAWMLRSGRSNARMRAFAYGYLGHASTDIFAHTYVNMYAGDIFVLSDGKWTNEYRHFGIESFIGKHTPPLTGQTGPAEQLLTTPFDELKDALILNDDVQKQYKKPLAFGAHLVYMREFGERIGEISGVVENILDRHKKEITRLDTAKTKATRQANELAGSIADEEGRLTAARKDLGEANKALELDKEVRTARTDEEARKTKDLRSAGDKAEKTIRQSGRKMEELKEARQEFLDRAAKLEKDSKTVSDSLASNVNPLSGFLLKWRGWIDRSLQEYMIMSGQVAVELTKDRGDPLKPMKDWYSCWGNVFLAPVPPKVCEFRNFIVEVSDKIDELRREFRKAHPLLAWILDPIGKLSDLFKKHLLPALKEKGLKLAKIIDKETGTLLEIIAKGVDDQYLDDLFSRDDSNQNLLIIPNISTRIKSDMNLDASGYFDPLKFNAAYNAVQLSKMALLGPEELNRLVKNLGINETLFSNGSDFNILIGTVRSIDGNHQWAEYGPPYPRRDGARDLRSREKRSYGKRNGLLFWQTQLLRETVFPKLFRGPIAPALEIPERMGFTKLLPDDYPYKATPENPFPNIRDYEDGNNR
jgi:hypothetical protein